MEKQLDTQVNYQDNHWLNIAETVAVVGSVGGTVASIFLKEMLLASIPLSACVVLNLINRKRLLSLITTQNNEAIATLSQHNQKDRGQIRDRIMEIEQSASSDREKHEIARNNISENVKQLDSSSQEKIQQLASKLINLAQNTVSHSPKLYCQNAIDYQQAGEELSAIKEYVKAIELDREYADAYAERGALYADMDNKQLAVEDLRKAAKLYFAQGDLDKYEAIKHKAQDVHQLSSDSASEKQDSEQVLANSLFT